MAGAELHLTPSAPHTMYSTMRPSYLAVSLMLMCWGTGAVNAGMDGSASKQQSEQEIEDIGVIDAAEGPAAGKFRAQIGAKSEFTSNAKLSGRHSSGDVLWMPSFEAGYASPLGNGFSIDIAAKIEAVLYSDNVERAFIGYSVPTTLDWRPNADAPRVYITLEPYRYDSFDTGGLITQAIALGGGTDWGKAFNSGKSLFFTGYSFMQYWADPTMDSRNTHRGVVGLTHQLANQLFGQAFYSYSYTDYTDIGRYDSKHILGLSLTYQFNRSLFGTLTGSFVDNDSSDGRASYQAAGGSIGFTYQF